MSDATANDLLSNYQQNVAVQHTCRSCGAEITEAGHPSGIECSNAGLTQEQLHQQGSVNQSESPTAAHDTVTGETVDPTVYDPAPDVE